MHLAALHPAPGCWLEMNHDQDQQDTPGKRRSRGSYGPALVGTAYSGNAEVRGKPSPAFRTHRRAAVTDDQDSEGRILNRDLRELLAESLGRPPGTNHPAQANHDLRRLREHGLIERNPAPQPPGHLSPTPACATPCSSPASTTGSCKPPSPSSIPQPLRHCAKPSAPPCRHLRPHPLSRNRSMNSTTQDHQTWLDLPGFAGSSSASFLRKSRL